MNVRVLIIDDEPHSTEAMRALCAGVAPAMEVVGVAHWMEDARRLMEEEKPDLLFLDVGLKDGCGLDLIPDFQKITGSGCILPVVLFSSGNLAASKAFDLGVLDYLDKPATEERFEVCCQRIQNYFREQRRFIPVDCESGREFVPVDEIAVIEVTVAGGSWTDCHLITGQTFKSVTKTILDWESTLPEERFFRTSRSQVFALGQIEDSVLRLPNGTGEFTVAGKHYLCSRSRWGDFVEAFSKNRSELGSSEVS